jgi:hypothetical protein
LESVQIGRDKFRSFKPSFPVFWRSACVLPQAESLESGTKVSALSMWSSLHPDEQKLFDGNPGEKSRLANVLTRFRGAPTLELR